MVLVWHRKYTKVWTNKNEGEFCIFHSLTYFLTTVYLCLKALSIPICQILMEKKHNKKQKLKEELTRLFILHILYFSSRKEKKQVGTSKTNTSGQRVQRRNGLVWHFTTKTFKHENLVYINQINLLNLSLLSKVTIPNPVLAFQVVITYSVTQILSQWVEWVKCVK